MVGLMCEWWWWLICVYRVEWTRWGSVSEIRLTIPGVYADGLLVFMCNSHSVMTGRVSHRKK